MRLFLTRLALALLLAFPAALPPVPMFGQSGVAEARTSGGYSRPSGGGGGFSSSASRRPSVGGSGGYARPSGGGSSGYGGSSSGGDRAISRRSSAEALRQYQAPPPAAPAYGGGGGRYDTRRPSTGGGGSWGWGDGRGRAAPTAAPTYGWAQQGRSFGVFDGLVLWGLLNSLSSQSSSRFFAENQNDPGYRQWRAEADRSAQEDPALRTRLAALDQQLAGTPAAPPEEEGGSIVYLVLFLGVALFVLLWLWRKRRATAAGPGGAPAALRGSERSRFRIGMTFPVDPSPFVLAAGATKVRGLEGGGMVSVEAVGVLMDGSVPLNRLVLPGGESFFLLHLGDDGTPDECRYFSRIDEVAPGSQDEWGAWLDPAQGMIGWPQFQTKDGRLYDRVWAPGAARIAPRAMTETIQALAGTTTRKVMAMLYGAPTGLAAPAPPTEYVLVWAVEAAGEAFVEIHAGIDVNPAALSLTSVPLT